MPSAIGMPQSLARILVHVVFSTKNREAMLTDTIRPNAFAYMATVGRDLGCDVFQVGGMPDHVHLAVGLSRTISIAEFVKKVKQTASVWIKENGGGPRFEWQAGYGAFSIGESQLVALVRYIEGQAEHHRVRTFQEEYRAMLAKYGVEGDERYLWD
jgi:putative transposase